MRFLSRRALPLGALCAQPFSIYVEVSRCVYVDVDVSCTCTCVRTRVQHVDGVF